MTHKHTRIFTRVRKWTHKTNTIRKCLLVDSMIKWYNIIDNDGMIIYWSLPSYIQYTIIISLTQLWNGFDSSSIINHLNAKYCEGRHLPFLIIFFLRPVRFFCVFYETSPSFPCNHLVMFILKRKKCYKL